MTDVDESVRTGEWVGDCFIYTNSTNRLNYLVGDQTYTISHFDQPMYMLGYLQRDGRIYLADKDVGVVSFALSVSVIEYQTLVLRGDLDSANELLGDLPEDQMNKIARFLEGQGYKEEALEVATDPEHRFELALALNKLDIALELARESDVEHKWKTVGDAALAAWDLNLASECFTHAKDLGSLLLMHTSSSNADGLKALATQANEAGANNVAFSALWSLGDIDACIDLLTGTSRSAEAVLFAQTYKPSAVPGLASSWKEGLEKDGKGKTAKLLGMPPGTEGVEADEDLFPEWDEWLRLEKGGEAVEEPSDSSLVDVGAEEGLDGADAEDGEATADAEDDAAEEKAEGKDE